MKGLTKRQREILDFIENFINKNRYSPSYREVRDRFGFASLGTVYKHVSGLKRKGFVSAEKGSSRSLGLEQHNPGTDSGVEIPLLGHIIAGYPIETFSQAQAITVPSAFVSDGKNVYALQARGETLNEEFIADGDILVVEARSEAHPGEMVLGLINDHDTLVKRYFPEGSYIRLESQNPHLQPIILRRDDVAIQGVLLGMFRLYRKG